jgi:hypothetical protein
MRKKIGFVTVYLLLSLFTAGAIRRDFEATFPTLLRDTHDCRENAGISLLFGLLPQAWLIAPFLTNEYQYGWMNPFASCGQTQRTANASPKARE